MVILESVLVALGSGVLKYLVNSALPQGLQSQVMDELAGLGVQLLASSAKETDTVAQTIGKRMNDRYRGSRLPENERNAALAEAIFTLEMIEKFAAAWRRHLHRSELRIYTFWLDQEPYLRLRPTAA